MKNSHDNSNDSGRPGDGVQRAQVSPFPLWLGLLTALAIGIYVGANMLSAMGVLPF